MTSRLALGLLTFCLGFFSSLSQASAQWPNWRARPVRPNIDVIPPLGNCLPDSYAARYNRPHYITGRIMYTIEPTSQEAMAWERAVQRGYYANHAPRMETFYIYPRAWEVLGIEPKDRPTDEGGPSKIRFGGEDAEISISPDAPNGHPGKPGESGLDLAPPFELLPIPDEN